MVDDCLDPRIARFILPFYARVSRFRGVQLHHWAFITVFPFSLLTGG